MNEAGTIIAGRCSDGGSIFSPAVYWIEDGVSEALDLDLPGLPSDATGEAKDANDDGVVIGIANGELRSFSWKDGLMTAVPNTMGGEEVTVYAINNHGLIVGYRHAAHLLRHLVKQAHEGERGYSPDLPGGRAWSLVVVGNLHAKDDPRNGLAFEHIIEAECDKSIVGLAGVQV